MLELQKRMRRRFKNETDIRNQARPVVDEQKGITPLQQDGDTVLALDRLQVDVADMLGAAVNAVAMVNLSN